LKKNLVSLASGEKNMCFQKMLAEKDLYDNPTWIGLNKIGQTKYSKWENGADLTSTDWHAKNPSSLSTKHCARA
jgi:hypothetical protein